MSTAKKCDRCGSFYDHRDIAASELRISKYVHCYGDKYFDLCDSCARDLEKFLENEDVKGR